MPDFFTKIVLIKKSCFQKILIFLFAPSLVKEKYHEWKKISFFDKEAFKNSTFFDKNVLVLALEFFKHIC